MSIIKAVQILKNFSSLITGLLHTFRQYRRILCIIFVFAVTAASLNVIAPGIIKKMSDVIVLAEVNHTSVDMKKIAYYGIILAGMYSAASLLSLTQNFMTARFTSTLTRNYRSQINKKINRLPLSNFDSHSLGDILSRMTNDVDTLAQGLSDSLNSMVTSISMVLGTIIMMLFIYWRLAVLVILMMPLSMAVIFQTIRFSQKYFVRQQKQLGEINGQAEEIISNHTVVYAFNAQQSAQKNFDEINTKLSRSMERANFFSSILHPVMNFMGNLTYVVICIAGGYIAVKKADVSFVTTIVLFITYMNIFNSQIGNIANLSSVLQANAAASQRITEFLESNEEVKENKEKRLSKVIGNIEFKNVSFGYDPEKMIIHNLNIQIKAGEKVAIVGPTGAGKTTLVNLLMRFYDVTSGDILIDGISVKDMSKEEVRSCFGMVLQDTWLFEGTIRENISFGAENADDAQIKNACQLAYIDRFVSSLPDGYDTVIDEKANISQGQRQLLTIARAVAGNPGMMILDEATSSVDTRTEKLIQNAMDSISQGKTSFVIAHRLSTIQNADLILVLKDGDIIEQGTHTQLLKANGFYAKLYRSQFAAE